MCRAPKQAVCAPRVVSLLLQQCPGHHADLLDMHDAGAKSTLPHPRCVASLYRRHDSREYRNHLQCGIIFLASHVSGQANGVELIKQMTVRQILLLD